MATIVRTFRYEAWARNLIGCACNAAEGVICGEHTTYVAPQHPTKPRREDFPTFGAYMAARREWKAPCDELAVCPLAAPVAAPAPTCQLHEDRPAVAPESDPFMCADCEKACQWCNEQGTADDCSKDDTDFADRFLPGLPFTVCSEGRRALRQVEAFDPAQDFESRWF